MTDKTDLVLSVIGHVNSGKSTLTGVLTKNILDDGSGFARNKVLKYPHEREKGQTSSISQNHMVLKNGRTVTFVDLAGHRKYLKTTMRGLNGYHIDYAIVLVSAKQGITEMTKEHIRTARSLNHPVIVLITKMDIAPDNLYRYTVKDIKKILKNDEYTSGQNIPVKINTEDKVNKYMEHFLMENTRIVPVFEISNKTGLGIDVLKKFIFSLPSRHNWNPFIDEKPIFRIFEHFKLDNIGHVFYGRVVSGTINNNDRLVIGPLNGDWLEISVKSIHANNRLPISELKTGKLGCVCVKFINKSYKFKYKKGMIITNIDISSCYSTFTADVYIVKSHKTTIKPGYEPIINCKTISQSARILHTFKKNIKDDKIETDCIIRGGDRAKIIFKFTIRPEHICVGDTFIIREGDTRGIAIVSSVE